MDKTKATRIARAAQFFPAHCKMPQISPGDTICMAAQDLIVALQNPNPQAPIYLEPKHNDALKRLAVIFHDTVKNIQPSSKGEAASPRVNLQPSTSHDTTSPRALRLITRIHQRKTRNNTPITENPTKRDNDKRCAPNIPVKRDPEEQTENQHPVDA